MTSYYKSSSEMGTKLSSRVDKQDDNIKNIHMSQMSLEKQVTQVDNSLNLFRKVGCLMILSQTQSNCLR